MDRNTKTTSFPKFDDAKMKSASSQSNHFSARGESELLSELSDRTTFAAVDVHKFDGAKKKSKSGQNDQFPARVESEFLCKASGQTTFASDDLSKVDGAKKKSTSGQHDRCPALGESEFFSEPSDQLPVAAVDLNESPVDVGVDLNDMQESDAEIRLHLAEESRVAASIFESMFPNTSFDAKPNPIPLAVAEKFDSVDRYWGPDSSDLLLNVSEEKQCSVSSLFSAKYNSLKSVFKAEKSDKAPVSGFADHENPVSLVGFASMAEREFTKQTFEFGFSLKCSDEVGISSIYLFYVFKRFLFFSLSFFSWSTFQTKSLATTTSWIKFKFLMCAFRFGKVNAPLKLWLIPS